MSAVIERSDICFCAVPGSDPIDCFSTFRGVAVSAPNDRSLARGARFACRRRQDRERGIGPLPCAGSSNRLIIAGVRCGQRASSHVEPADRILRRGGGRVESQVPRDSFVRARDRGGGRRGVRVASPSTQLRRRCSPPPRHSFERLRRRHPRASRRRRNLGRLLRLIGLLRNRGAAQARSGHADAGAGESRVGTSRQRQSGAKPRSCRKVTSRMVPGGMVCLQSSERVS